MRFFADGPSIPDSLLESCDAGRVVFLCGAGVSLNSGMPTFFGLTQHVIDYFDPPDDSQIMQAFSPWITGASVTNIPLDQIFNLLHQEYGKNEINALVTERLLIRERSESVGYEHNLVKRISSNQNGIPQIVTTNFDLLFEQNNDSDPIIFHQPPAFPGLEHGSSIGGITYLHGRLASSDGDQHSYVLSSADFGRAYLSEAWATKFISGLLEHYTVVLVGYQAEDPPVKYLLQGLNHDGQSDKSRLYAFDKGVPQDIEVKWRDRGVTSIAYEDHSHLWQTLAAWADRADDPRLWRNRVIASAESDPKRLSPHERGQVVHVLRSVKGAKLFAEIEPTPHPEWICVLDAYTRCAQKSSNLGSNTEVFEPVLAYGLDDDIGPISDEEYRRGVRNTHLLVWHSGDESLPEIHRLVGRRIAEREVIPNRLWQLARWIAKSHQSPIVAWWASRQFGLHPRLISHIDWHLRKNERIDDRALHVWNLILEYHCEIQDWHWDCGWYQFERRVAKEGWTPSVIREFYQVTLPRLDIKQPFGLLKAKPPSSDWNNLDLHSFARFEVKFADQHNRDIEIPNAALPQIIRVLEDQLRRAAGMLADLGGTYFRTPTCYPNRGADREERDSESDKQFLQFIELYDRLAVISPMLAKARAIGWDQEDEYFFRKLKLYAVSKPNIFDSVEMANAIKSLTQDAFWDDEVVRELLFVLTDRWFELSDADKEDLSRRIVSGPDKVEHWSDEEYPKLRDRWAAKYARYLQINGCDLPIAHASKLDKLISKIVDWNDGWANSLVKHHGVRGGWVQTDETPDEFLNLPVGEIISKSEALLQRDFDSLLERRPFTGLVKANPRKALSALSTSAKVGEFPQAFWSTLINEFPKEVSSRLYRTFLCRIARLPHKVVTELRHPLSQWIRQSLKEILDFDACLGWKVYDHIVDGILASGSESTKSGLGEIHRRGKVVQRSRRTYEYAINGPLGSCALALVNTIHSEQQEVRSLIPNHIKTRLERLWTSNGEGGDHVVSILLSSLNQIMHIDPFWSKEHLIPRLDFEHPASEPAWSGLLHGGNPTSDVAKVIKPLLLEFYTYVQVLDWDDDASKRAAAWMSWMCIFRQGEADGLEEKEMRKVLRVMSDTVRIHVIFWLRNVGSKNTDGWIQLVIPFIENVWPRERVLCTNASVSAWIDLLGYTGVDFPKIYAAVKRFLVPIEDERLTFYQFTREMGEDQPISSRYPQATLDFLNTVTPSELLRPPHDLPKILGLIEDADRKLTTDPRYLRLIDVVESS